MQDLGAIGSTTRQTLVNIDEELKGRFGAYIEAQKKATGGEPPAAKVVQRAFRKAYKDDSWLLLQNEEAQRDALGDEDEGEDDDELNFILGEAEGRRAARGSVRNKQGLPFRPSRQELATYDAFAQAVGFKDRTAFVNAILHAFLPEETKARRTRRPAAPSEDK